MGMLEDCHPDHAWYQFISEPGHLGFAGTARERTWVIGSHMELTTCTSDPYEIYDDIRSWFTDYCQCKVSDYLVASEQEVRMEALEVANKLGLAHFVPGHSPMSILLNHRESNVARDLNEKYFQRTGYRPDSNPNLVYGLGDSASKGPGRARRGAAKTLSSSFRTWHLMPETHYTFWHVFSSIFGSDLMSGNNMIIHNICCIVMVFFDKYGTPTILQNEHGS